METKATEPAADCSILPPSYHGPSHPHGCPGAVWSSGSPSKRYCDGDYEHQGDQVFPWWSQCCVWSGGSCKPKGPPRQQLRDVFCIRDQTGEHMDGIGLCDSASAPANSQMCNASTAMSEGQYVTRRRSPTQAPSEAPTEAPTPPTEAPSQAPSGAPSGAPTEAPTQAPTEAPSEAPSEAPTEAPTETPTEAPTEAPTATPTAAPTSPTRRRRFPLRLSYHIRNINNLRG